MEWLIGITTIMVALATLMVYYATTKVSVATTKVSNVTRDLGRIQIRPYVFAYLRDKAKGVGIYVENVGFGPAIGGKIAVKTNSGNVIYTFERIYPHGYSEHPTGQQGRINVTESDKGIEVSISYVDMEKQPYTWEGFLSFEGWT